MDLKVERENLIHQRDNAFNVYQQCIGAISILDFMITEKDKEDNVVMTLTEDELQEKILNSNTSEE